MKYSWITILVMKIQRKVQMVFSNFCFHLFLAGKKLVHCRAPGYIAKLIVDRTDRWCETSSLSLPVPSFPYGDCSYRHGAKLFQSGKAKIFFFWRPVEAYRNKFTNPTLFTRDLRLNNIYCETSFQLKNK